MTEEESSRRLRQLLRLKRHETPPPGYFREFSGGVMERIRSVEAERSVPLWRRWFFRGANPSMAGSASADGFWPAWAGQATGVAGVAILMGLVGGLYWATQGGGSPVGDVAGDGTVAGQVGSHQASVSEAVSNLTAARAGLNGGPMADRSPSGWPSGLSAPAGSSTDRLLSQSTTQVPEGRFRLPVSVSVSGAPVELSSTNPFPPGLFRLPGGSEAEAYRVRLGQPQR